MLPLLLLGQALWAYSYLGSLLVAQSCATPSCCCCCQGRRWGWFNNTTIFYLQVNPMLLCTSHDTLACIWISCVRFTDEYLVYSFHSGRVRRIACGAGVMEREVLELVKQYTKFAQVSRRVHLNTVITRTPHTWYPNIQLFTLFWSSFQMVWSFD